MTILGCCISLKMIKKILVVLGVVDMIPASVKSNFQYFCFRCKDKLHVQNLSKCAISMINLFHKFLKPYCWRVFFLFGPTVRRPLTSKDGSEAIGGYCTTI